MVLDPPPKNLKKEQREKAHDKAVSVSGGGDDHNESVTISPQNSSQAQTPKTPTPKPNRKLIIQISKDKFVWDESSDSRNCQ